MAALFQFQHYLDQLKNEIELFPDDASLWVVPPGIVNSPGNLALHLAGNLQHFIGAVIGKSGYVRQREMEFSQKNLSKTAVLAEIQEAYSVTTKVLSALTAEERMKDYPEPFKGKVLPIHFALSHLFGHLAYHTGQINYLRRILHP